MTERDESADEPPGVGRNPRARALERAAAQGPSAGVLAGGLWADDEAELELLASGGADAVVAAEPARSGGGAGAGHRSRARQQGSRAPYRGRAVRAVAAGDQLRDVAWVATLRRAAVARRRPQREDVMRHERVIRPRRLLVFVADASGSMGGELTRIARRAATAVLRDAYVRRDQVAMIAFRERTAELVFGPTDQIERVNAALDGLPVGGTTPLAAGLALARSTVRRARAARVAVVLISDGRANVGARRGYESIVAEVEAEARELASVRGLRVVFLDATADGQPAAPAARLCRALGAEHLQLARLADPADALARALTS